MKIFLVMRGTGLDGGGGAERRFGRLFTFFSVNRKPDLDVYLVTNRVLAQRLIMCGIVDSDAERLIYPEEEMGILAFNRWLIHMVRYHRPDVVHLVLIQRSLLPFYLWLLTNRSVVVVSTLASASIALDGRCSLMQAVTAHIVWAKSRIIDSLYPGTEKSIRLTPWKDRVRISPCSFSDYSQYKPSPAKTNTIVFAGRLSEVKNPMLLLRAIANINQSEPDLLARWRVAIYGKGELERDVISFIDKYGLRGSITVASVNSMTSVLSESRVFVSLQHVDNYPSQSLLEAMACENVVIATDVGNTRLLVNENTGILIHPSTYSLSEALSRVMHDWDAYAPCATRARLYVIENHSVDRFASYLLKVWIEGVST
ncbi:MAG TPA: glycosyltransferase family 4 protein [Firmicutes bacterium]|nr:glycosyltransferase family 4 protein [Bacillota bacterium]